MRPQLFRLGVAVIAMGVFFFALGPFLSLPTPLTLSPTAGPAGTLVTATGSGLPPNSRVYFYWFGEPDGGSEYRLVGTASVGSEGGFSPPATFSVPESYSGLHNVTASSEWFGQNTTAVPVQDVEGVASFNLTSVVSNAPPPSGPSPLVAWGLISVVSGVAIVVLGIFAKQGEGPIEAPPGFRFCPYCSASVPVGALRCPNCNGIQPRDGC